MQQLNPQHYPVRPMHGPPMGNPAMGNPAMGNPNMGNPLMAPQNPNFLPFRPPAANYPSEQDQKKKEFARGIFVSGFEKCVTTAMLQKHFNIKPINGLKHPMTKLKESKGFAFIYYGSEDDALYVKKTLDRTAILKEKVRITRTVISENLSKMMFKLKTHGLSEKEVQQNEDKYFSDEKLQKEVDRIIKPIFGNNVEVNKITIPRSRSDKKPLRYARVFFYVGDVKEARAIAERTIKSSDAMFYDTTGKNEYEIILNCISHKINNDEIFIQYGKSQIYEYSKKNQSNVLHLKGVKYNGKEDSAVLADEIKDFMQAQGPHWDIVNAYAAIQEERGAWANLTFASYEDTVQAYETLKNTRPKFRDGVLYGSLRNVKDPRTVVISVVKNEVTEKDVEKFLNELAAKSVKTVNTAEEQIRKYEYFSFNIIESKKFYKVDGDETKGITETDKQAVHPSWIEINEVPRRLIIHFFHEFNDEDIKELNNDITVTPGYESIFLKGDRNRQLRSNHQKGHVNKDGIYIKHTELKGKKKVKAPRTERPKRPYDPNYKPQNRGPGFSRPNDFTGGLNLDRRPPKIPSNLNLGGGNSGYRPPGIGAVGGLNNVPPPNMSNPNMRPPFNSPPYMPGSNVPPSNMPPTNAPPSNLPPQNIPPQFKSNYPNNMGNMMSHNMPPNMPPGPRPPMMQGGPMPSNYPPHGFNPNMPPKTQPPPPPPKQE